ncbi:MAG: helix-turn-helix domain-containing protein [Lachnospiraceae bacterium]
MSDKKNQAHYEIIQVPGNTGVRFFTSVDPGSYVPVHWHHALEIIYMLEGELTVTVENNTTLLTADQCIIINADVMHSTKCTALNKAIVLQIPLDFIEIYIPDIRQLLFRIDDSNSSRVKETKVYILKQTLSQMQIANDIRPEGFILRFNSLLFELLFQLYHNFSVKMFKANLNQKSKDMSRLDSILQYTKRNYNRPISIEEISSVAFLQPRYFCRFFKKYMGITFLEYQNELRLSYIYRDLTTTNKPVHEILELHGFTNYKLFRRMFSEHFECTPSRIRKMQKK